MKARLLMVGALLLLLGALPTSAQEENLTPPPTPIPVENVEPMYPGRREGINCPDYASQAAAQATLRSDPTDPAELDTDRDGIACELNAEPRDMVPVPR
jgi:hypothetical protein